MSEKEFNAARAVVYAGAGAHVQALVEKKAKLQARADKLKQELEKLIGDVDQVDKDITVKDAEIQETAKAFKDLTADSTSTAFRALETVLAEAGHELSEATRAKMKATLVTSLRTPSWPGLMGHRNSSPGKWRGRMAPPAPTCTAIAPTPWMVPGRKEWQGPATPRSRGAGAGSSLPAPRQVQGLRPLGSPPPGRHRPQPASSPPGQF